MGHTSTCSHTSGTVNAGTDPATFSVLLLPELHTHDIILLLHDQIILVLLVHNLQLFAKTMLCAWSMEVHMFALCAHVSMETVRRDDHVTRHSGSVHVHIYNVIMILIMLPFFRRARVRGVRTCMCAR